MHGLRKPKWRNTEELERDKIVARKSDVEFELLEGERLQVRVQDVFLDSRRSGLVKCGHGTMDSLTLSI